MYKQNGGGEEDHSCSSCQGFEDRIVAGVQVNTGTKPWGVVFIFLFHFSGQYLLRSQRAEVLHALDAESSLQVSSASLEYTCVGESKRIWLFRLGADGRLSR